MGREGGDRWAHAPGTEHHPGLRGAGAHHTPAGVGRRSAGVKWLSVIGLALLLGLVVFVWSRGSGPDVGVAATDGVPVSEAAGASPGLPYPEAGATTRHGLRELASGSPASRPDDAADERATLRGRCISAETGEPLAGMR